MTRGRFGKSWDFRALAKMFGPARESFGRRILVLNCAINRSVHLPIGDGLYSEIMPKAGGSFLLGVLLCWLFNLVEVCIGLLLWFATERYLPAVYVLIYAVGLVQVGYVAPLWRLLERQGKGRAANGLMWAALVTLVVNLAVNYWLFGTQMLPFRAR